MFYHISIKKLTKKKSYKKPKLNREIGMKFNSHYLNFSFQNYGNKTAPCLIQKQPQIEMVNQALHWTGYMDSVLLV